MPAMPAFFLEPCTIFAKGFASATYAPTTDDRVLDSHIFPVFSRAQCEAMGVEFEREVIEERLRVINTRAWLCFFVVGVLLFCVSYFIYLHIFLHQLRLKRAGLLSLSRGESQNDA